MGDLKRCPFCGHRAKVFAGKWENDFEVYVFNAHVFCMGCGVRTKEYEAYTEDKEEQDEAIDFAIDAWNTRQERG